MLAAGASRRFGADKRVARLPSGQGILATSVQVYLQAVGNCTVVIDRHDDELKAILFAAGATVVQVDSRKPPLGMGDSLAGGMRQIAAEGCDACLLGLGDMPWVAPSTLARLMQCMAQSPLVVPVWQGRWGHPVGFAARYFPLLCALSGDRGARVLLESHAADLLEVPVDDAGVVQDVDTVGDIRNYRECR